MINILEQAKKTTDKIMSYNYKHEKRTEYTDGYFKYYDGHILLAIVKEKSVINND